MKLKAELFENKKGENILRGISLIPENISDSDFTVIMIHGFERVSTTEEKFKKTANALADLGITSLRFDCTGIGLSDGNFENTTVASMSDDLENMIDAYKQRVKKSKVSLIGHSLGAAVIANILNKRNDIEKIVLLAPALNQKDLMRFWYVTNVMKRTKPNLSINWNNYKDYLNENDFINDSYQDKIIKSHRINSQYFKENMNKDYSTLLEGYKNRLLHLHGSKDESVPIESISFEFPNKLIIDDGNHDLEKPGIIEQWLEKTIKFLI